MTSIVGKQPMEKDAYTLAEFFTYLANECGYTDMKVINEDEYACIVPFLFTHAIIKGRIGNARTYDDRWCFHDYDAAKTALDAWDGKGEPEGWHRHPLTGRRRYYEEQELIEVVNP